MKKISGWHTASVNWLFIFALVQSSLPLRRNLLAHWNLTADRNHRWTQASVKPQQPHQGTNLLTQISMEFAVSTWMNHLRFRQPWLNHWRFSLTWAYGISARGSMEGAPERDRGLSIPRARALRSRDDAGKAGKKPAKKRKKREQSRGSPGRTAIIPLR